MSDPGFAAFTRRAAEAVSRRGSLRTLGAAAVAAGLLAPALTEAKKGGNKGKSKCKKQVSRCKEGVAEACEAIVQPNNVAQCIETFAECCEPLRGCNAAAAADCLVERLQDV